jgi:multicomponent Na+:H+ antiporter subunit A
VLITVLVLHGVIGVAVFGAGRPLGRRAFGIAAIAPAVTLAWVVALLDRTLNGRVTRQSLEWVPALDLSITLRLDAFAVVMALIITIVGLAVLGYSCSYFDPDDPGLGRLAGLLTLFGGAMLGIVLADDLITLFTAWEITSVVSYLLIGNEHTRTQARAAALHALLVTSTGGLAMLAGIVLIGQAAGTYRISELLRDPPTGTTVTTGLVLVAVGAFTKSAQYPFHSWLPGAMAAPTPVSAYLHSATMVKAGVYLLARFAPVFALHAPWRPLVVTVGLVTMIAGGLRALRQYDLKLLLAHGTVSQLGFLVVLFGVGIPGATAAGILAIVAHAAFKAALFLTVGVIDHQTGTRDIRLVPPLGDGWRVVKVTVVVAAASMAGVPLLAGFLAKEAAYDAFVGGPFAGSVVVATAVVAGSALTVAYTARFAWGILLLPARLRSGSEGVTIPVRADAVDAGDVARVAPPPRLPFTAAAALLAGFGVVAGVAPAVLDRLDRAATTALDPAASPGQVALWHGFGAPLYLTVVTFGLGATLFALRHPVSRWLRLGELVPTGTDAYLRILHGLNRTATRVTAVVQNGTLPIYVGVVLVTAAGLPGVVLLLHGEWPGWPRAVGRPIEIPIAAFLIGGAIAAATVRRRFTAVLFLSLVGYGMSALFVAQGAPDLALTQAAVETVSTVLFVLVLRKLPDRFERRSTPATRMIRVAVSVLVATLVFVFAIVARGSRTATPVSDEMIERSLPEGHGRNVVNVILVDFRGWDTMGELTVLAAAAIGAVALARVGRRPDPSTATSERGPS